MIVDLFAGPGGWDVGLDMIGRRDVIGLEWDEAACLTARAAGHHRIQADIGAIPAETIARWDVEGLIASPPCQAWSMAGKRKGELDRANCHALADRMANGDDSTDWTAWEDERSPLVCEPIRWARVMRPEWIALEEVPDVAGLWEHFARIYRSWGYSVWTGVLCAADYGVPQTRKRAILMAHKSMTVQPPVPTHAEKPHGFDLFGGRMEKWVSMATALGWGDSQDLTGFVAAGITGAGKPKDGLSQPADTITGKGTAYWFRASNQAHSAIRHIGQPAPTLLFGHASNDVRWYPKDGTEPGRSEAAASRHPESRRVTVQEAGILQSFPADYPWRGNSSKQYQQVGNAVPPLLAAHVVTALGAGRMPLERAA